MVLFATSLFTAHQNTWPIKIFSIKIPHTCGFSNWYPTSVQYFDEHYCKFSADDTPLLGLVSLTCSAPKLLSHCKILQMEWREI